MIELRNLRAFVALAETGNLSRAARRLNFSQPALSHQIATLEEHFETRLFERKSNPLRLTPAGDRLLAAAFQTQDVVDGAERDIARIAGGRAGSLRIAVECHSCFDWLMPAMDAFRERWPDVEMDLVSGFHGDPIGLLGEDRADLVIVSRAPKRAGVRFHPLFRYEVLALLAHRHALVAKPHLTARDFARETLVTYPIPDERIDVLRDVLKPAGVDPERRTTYLTVAILQLVASGRGIAALPGWVVQPYLDRNYVTAKRIRRNGLFSQLYAATTDTLASAPYMREFLDTMHRISFAELKGIAPVNRGSRRN